jgi:hypothetical protein
MTLGKGSCSTPYRGPKEARHTYHLIYKTNEERRKEGRKEKKERNAQSPMHMYTNQMLSTFYLQYLKTFGKASTGLPNRVVVGYGGSGSCPI